MSKTIEEQYPELLHYTTAAGLNGILRSGSLWASHASFLNDAEEITHYFDVRFPQIDKVQLEFTQELVKSPEILKNIDARGGIEKMNKECAALLVKALRETILPFNEPYIFSMSAAGDERISQSGLLSQWRGYGTDGGYALVFDAVRFHTLIDLEKMGYKYIQMWWGQVHYHGIDSGSQPTTEDVSEWEAAVRKRVAEVVRSQRGEGIGDIYEPMCHLSCLCKHWGFSEEGEVRVVAIPSDAKIAEMAALEGDVRPHRVAKTFIRDGMPVPYLDLFANLPNHPAQLPIKRIIVGPHRDKALRAEAVLRLLRDTGYKDVEVICSEIPYIGR